MFMRLYDISWHEVGKLYFHFPLCNEFKISQHVALWQKNKEGDITQMEALVYCSLTYFTFINSDDHPHEYLGLGTAEIYVWA